MGGRVKREGHTYAYGWHVDAWQRATQYWEAIFLQLKINKLWGESIKSKANNILRPLCTFFFTDSKSHLFSSYSISDASLLLNFLTVRYNYYYFYNFYFVLGVQSVNKQCCDSFRWTAKGLSHTYTCIHSPPNSLPSRLAHSIDVLFSSWVVGWPSVLLCPELRVSRDKG